MEQAFLLPMPKFNGPRRLPEVEPWKENETAEWSSQLDRLTVNKSLWPEMILALQTEETPAAHPLAKSALSSQEQSLLHIAVLDDRLDCINLLGKDKFLLERRNRFGLTALELALFLHKQKSASILSSEPINSDFLNQPKVEFDASERLIDIKYLQQPIFESQEVLEEILTHGFRAKRDDAVPHDRIWMGIYYDKEIQKGIHPRVAVRWIDESIGFGVYAREKIMPCSFVGEYTGLIQERKTKHIRESNYCFRYTSWQIGKRHYVADAERMGNFTRFINHSDQPNVALVCAYWRGLPRLILISLSEIAEGDQLTFDYGNLFWKQASKLKKKNL